jgi:hypothetical protein
VQGYRFVLLECGIFVFCEYTRFFSGFDSGFGISIGESDLQEDRLLESLDFRLGRPSNISSCERSYLQSAPRESRRRCGEEKMARFRRETFELAET